MQGFQHKALDIVWSQVIWVLSILSVTQVGFCHLPCLQGTLGAQTVLNELQETVFLKFFYKRLCHHLDCVTLDSQPPRMIPGGYHFDFQKKSQKGLHQKLPWPDKPQTPGAQDGSFSWELSCSHQSAVTPKDPKDSQES